MGPLAVFGITNDGLNLAVNLLLLFLVVFWIALVYWTYADARRRIEDPMLVGCAAAASMFPFVGTIVYTIVRPPEYLEDVRERELEIAAAEARLASSEHLACPTATTRSRGRSCAARAACAGSRSRAARAASRSTRAGRSAPTARPRCGPRAAAGAPAPATRRARARAPEARSAPARRPAAARRESSPERAQASAAAPARARRPGGAPRRPPPRAGRCGLSDAARPRAAATAEGKPADRPEGQRERASKPTRERARRPRAPRGTARAALTPGPCLTTPTKGATWTGP